MRAKERRALADRAARAGAAVAMERFRDPLDVETKTGPLDLVTEADRASQRAVLGVLRDADPGAAIVAEEDAAAESMPSEGPAWIVDPIDGTRNYVAGSRLWATSVAAVEDGEAVAATNRLPALGDTYALGADGVTRNGAAVSPSDRSTPGTFTVAPLGMWPDADRDRFAALCRALVTRFGDLRRHGCAQAALAMVASGELDAVVATRRLAPWDSVAGAAMVERAGGTVTDVAGDRWGPAARGLVASSGRAHDVLLAAAQDALE